MDIAWGLGFVLIAYYSLIKAALYQPSHLLITSLITIWGIRLSAHIYLRNKGRGEDQRYKKWRHEWGNSFVWRSYMQIFLLQGLMMFLISLPIIVINNNTKGDLNTFTMIGLIVWAIGFFFESIGDYQLYQFIKNKHDQKTILQTGVWRYTRHPNYFGEVTMWWGIFIISLPNSYALLCLISPLLITFLILYVSGIPMTEQMFADNPEFQQYKKKTSAFFPWFPTERLQ